MNENSTAFVSVIIAAGGQGTRLGVQGGKQFLKIDGESILSRTVSVFENCKAICEIIIVIENESIERCQNEILSKSRPDKIIKIVEGGVDRQESVFNGLRAVSESAQVILVHDGARPFIREQTIIRSIETANQYGAAVVAVRSKDTIKIAQDEILTATPDRSRLWAVQTPQTFRRDIIMDAYHKAHENGFKGTDDASLVEQTGLYSKIVEGDYYNIKITTQEDLVFAEAIIRANSNQQ